MAGKKGIGKFWQSEITRTYESANENFNFFFTDEEKQLAFLGPLTKWKACTKQNITG